jgi:3-oxoacyl-[acyl-carrier-protein] synthase III
MDGGLRTGRVAGTGSFLPPTAVDNRTLFQNDALRGAFDVERARGSLKAAAADRVGAGRVSLEGAAAERVVPERASLEGAAAERAVAGGGSLEGVAAGGAEDTTRLTPEEVFDRWARQVTGITVRRLCQPGDGLTTERMCAEAGGRALSTAGLEATDLDLILVATVSPSDGVPNAACTVAELLGAPGVGGFTLNGACTGYIHALAAAYGFIRSGVAETVLIAAGDTLSRITDYGDPTTAVLFSDGASAAVLTASDVPGVMGPPALSAGYARDHLYLLGQGWETEAEPDPKLRMGGGPRILRRAIVAMEEVAHRALERAGVGWDSVDLVIPHQANLRITRGLEHHLELPRGRVLHIIERYGNCSAATVGIALDEALRGVHGPIPRPARVVLTAVGGGYTMAAAVLEV